MKKTLNILLSISLGIGICSGIYKTKSVQAVEFESSTKVNEQLASNELRFISTNSETIKKMKEHSLKNKENSSDMIIEKRITLSDATAKALDLAGFKHSAYLLNYSMLSLREEPLVFEPLDTISQDMWNYSNDFEAAVKGFLFNAQGKSEYFATTTINFKMPSESKPAILANTALKKRTDLFGALHTVTINLGYVKNSSHPVIVLVQDRYDFQKEQYNGLTNFVNNIAYYDQVKGKIKPYNIEIYADYMRSGLPYGINIW